MSECITWREVVRYAEEGQCWLCPRGGFKKLGQHLALAHGLHADEVRARFGLSWTQPLCTDDYRVQAREALVERPAFLRSRPASQGEARTRYQAQTRAAMAEVAQRPEVKAKLRERNADPVANRTRLAGHDSPKARQQWADAKAKRWSTRAETA